MHFRKYYWPYISGLLITALFTCCKKVIEADLPKDQLIAAEAFTDSSTAVAVLLNIYTQFARNGGTIEGNYAPYPSLYTDELIPVNTTPIDLEFYSAHLKPDNDLNAAIWKSLYFEIYECNAFLEGIAKSATLNQPLKDRLAGEAKFLRALGYFLLTNTYGDVPLVLTTDVTVSALLPRTTVAGIYEQIVSDLSYARETVSVDYLTSEKVRVNKSAAEALLARVKIYTEQWDEAEALASSVIESEVFTLEKPENVFLKNSAETILAFYERDGYTWSGSYFLPFFGSPTYVLSETLLNAFSAEDLREQQWMEPIEYNGNIYRYPFKYRNGPFITANEGEYTMCLRLGEQYLIRAEARCRQNRIPEALADLNVIRERAGLQPVSMPVTNDFCFSLIMQERRKELFTEWGHRFFDLKRVGLINEIQSSLKPSWSSTDALFPLPLTELSSNPHLTQNPGY